MLSCTYIILNFKVRQLGHYLQFIYKYIEESNLSQHPSRHSQWSMENAKLEEAQGRVQFCKLKINVMYLPSMND